MARKAKTPANGSRSESWIATAGHKPMWLTLPAAAAEDVREAAHQSRLSKAEFCRRMVANGARTILAGKEKKLSEILLTALDSCESTE